MWTSGFPWGLMDIYPKSTASVFVHCQCLKLLEGSQAHFGSAAGALQFGDRGLGPGRVNCAGPSY